MRGALEKDLEQPVELVWVVQPSGIGRYLAVYMGPEYADCGQVARKPHFGGGMGKLFAVLKWHSLQNAVQDGPPYRKAFRLPFLT